MHPNSMKLMCYFRDEYLRDIPGATILDVGSRQIKKQKTYRDLLSPKFSYVGMDLEPGKNVDVVGYENIPGLFDVVISGQVMEHIEYPWEWLKSLKKYFNRYICIIAPNKWNEHRYPIDTFRYFPDGIRALFAWAEIREIEILKSGNDTMGIGRM